MTKKGKGLWTPLSTQFFRDPEVRAAGRDAALLYLAALGYVTVQKSDGFVPRDMVAVLAAEAWSKPSQARRLVERGLWEEVEGGYLVAGWMAWNWSRDEMDDRREDARDRQRRRRERLRAAVTDPVTRDTMCDEDVSHADVTPPPTPTPSEPPPNPPEGGVPDPRIIAALNIATEDERNARRRSRAIADLGAKYRPVMERWLVRWPDMDASQLAEGLRLGGKPPPSTRYLTDTQAVVEEPEPPRRAFEVVR